MSRIRYSYVLASLICCFVFLCTIYRKFNPRPEMMDSKEPITTSVKKVKMKRQIVIAHYDENLDWLKPYANMTHVYDKGGVKKQQSLKFMKWETLPNVGREAHTYVHHIIKNYNDLADITLFLQGHEKSPDWACFSSAKEFFEKAENGEFCKRTQPNSNWNRLNHIGKWKNDLISGKLKASAMTLGEFYKAIFDGKSPPESVPVCLTACFSASRDNLRKYPIEFYKNILTKLDKHYNPEEAHYMERLWCHIIGG